MDEFDEALLNFDQLEKWAAAKGYECVVSEDEETTTLIMHYTDKANTGFMNGAERMVSGLFDGAFGKAEDELTARALLPSAVEKYISNGNLKDAMKEQAKDTTSAIGWGAFEKGFEYIFMDTEVYRIYIYDKNSLDKSASLGMISYLKSNHENPKTSYGEKYDKFELDGEEIYYHFSEMFNRDVDISIGEDETYGWCSRWVIYLLPKSL